MKRPLALQPPNADMLDEALDLIEGHFRGRVLPRQASATELGALLDDALHRINSPQRVEPVRVVRQFACTGGTLICRGLQAQPNTLVLSEVDPFSTTHLALKKPDFTPTDIIRLADPRLRPLDPATKQEMFTASLGVLHATLSKQGRRLVVREHSHGQFCSDLDWTARPSVLAVIETILPVLQVVTVRHPLDSWISLGANGWTHFTPFTIEEYARRYMAFLDTSGSAPVFRYEEFVNEPDKMMVDMCDRLELKLNEAWQTLVPVISMSGDSGRGGARIQPRERLPITDEMRKEVQSSEVFAALCARLGYVPLD